MELSLSDIVQPEELLYRAIKRSQPSCVTKDGKHVSAAFYKDKNGNSVDRDGGRKEEDIVTFMRDVTFRSRMKGVARILAEKCFQIGADVKPAPTKGVNPNPYHANILLNATELKRQDIQAFQLAQATELRALYDTPPWMDSSGRPIP